MNKEDILAKNRAEKLDEGIEYAENKGRKWGFVIFFAMAVIMQLSIMFLAEGHHRTAMNAIMALLFTFFSTEALVKWRFTRESGHMVALIVGILMLIISVIAFYVEIFGASGCCCG